MPEHPETYLFNIVEVQEEDPQNPGQYKLAEFGYHIIIGRLRDDPPTWPPQNVDPIHVNEVRSGGAGGMWEVPAAQNYLEICFGKKTETAPGELWEEYGFGVTLVPWGPPWHVRFIITFPLKTS